MNEPGPERDRIAWAVPALALLLVLAHSLPAPLGEPVADDFDFLSSRLHGQASFFSGSGSTLFWRPIPHTLYYAVMGRAFFALPWLAPALHFVLLGAIAVLFVLTLRPRAGLPAACFAAGFVLLSEPSRALLAWPSHFVELALLTALAACWLAIDRGRPIVALVAFALALLSKESALIAAPLLLFAPRSHAEDRAHRTLWVFFALTATAWLAAYAWVARHTLAPPVWSFEPGSPGLLARGWWAIRNTLEVLLGIDTLTGRSRALVLFGYLAVLGSAVVVWVRGRRSRHEGVDRALAVWGGAWLLAWTATCAVTYPVWASHRAWGAGIGAAALILSLRPAGRLPFIALLCLKCAAFLSSPPPPASVSTLPPSPNAFADFQRLTRLQILMRDIRRTLASPAPTPSAGPSIVQRDFPLAATYALGGSHALQVWLADTAATWIPYSVVQADSGRHAHWLLLFVPDDRPSVQRVPGRALDAQLRGDRLAGAGRVADALDAYREALDEAGAGASSFAGTCRHRVALCFAQLGRRGDAIIQSEQAVTLRPYDRASRFLLAVLYADAGRVADALTQVDFILRADPRDPEAKQLRAQLASSPARGE